MDVLIPALLEGLVVTVQATLGAFVLAAILGLIFAMLRRIKNKWISIPLFWFIEFIRTTPFVIQAVFMWRVLPVMLGIPLSPLTVGILALGLHYSTYLSEVYRSGIDSVPKGQWEASTALNFNPAQKWMRIILPQAIPPVIPVMGNYLIVMFKEVPVLMAITLTEMLLAANSYISSTFADGILPYSLVALLFLAVSYPSSLLVRTMESKLNRQRGT
jgi:polar amino acid transport system permease protein